MQEHYRLADGITEDEANLIINNATWKVIQNAFKHVCCISVASYYTQVNLLPLLQADVEVIFFYFDKQMEFFFTRKC
jgi:hypothetical protein